MAPTTPPGNTSKPASIPQLSTLRRKGAEVFSESAFSSDNPFEPDDFELEGSTSPSKMPTEESLKMEPSTPDEIVSDAASSPSPRMSGLRVLRRRRATSMLTSPAPDADERFKVEDEWVFIDPPSKTDSIAKPPAPVLSTPKFAPLSRPATASPRISTLRRKTGEIFSDEAYSSNPFDADESEFDESTTLLRPSTLRRKTDELFSGSRYLSDLFDPDESEFDKASPSLRASTLRRKTNELFSTLHYSANPFAPDDAEFDQPSPHHTVHGKLVPSLKISSTKPAKAALSLISVEASSDSNAEEQTKAVDVLLKANLEVPPNTLLVSPGLSTFKRESANLFAESSIWGNDDDFVAKLETMRLHPTQRIRGIPLNSLGIQPSPLSSSLTIGDKENIPPLRSARPSPFRPIFDTSERDSIVPEKYVPKAPEAETQDGGPVKSIWGADEDEFDRWPDKDDLAATVKSFAIHRGTFNGLKHRSASLEVNGEIASNIAPIRGANMTEQEHDDFMHQLLDKNCGNPDGIDAHDEVIQQFYQRDCKLLPASNSAGCPHVIGVSAYMKDEDRIVQNARPRLADAVATVLHLTHSKCLADFLDPDVTVFEWRRSRNAVLIRREGHEVIVGTYQNYGTCYVWTYFVRSQILKTGAWKEVYAGASQITTPVSAAGIEFERFVAESTLQGIDPVDENYALFMGRVLGGFLLEKSIWDYPARITWEVDGRVINAREYAYEALRLAREEDE